MVMGPPVLCTEGLSSRCARMSWAAEGIPLPMPSSLLSIGLYFTLATDTEDDELHPQGAHAPPQTVSHWSILVVFDHIWWSES
jgi:hypothetical protein